MKKHKQQNKTYLKQKKNTHTPIINLNQNTIKNAIVHSRYQAAKLINKELFSLYFAVGKYISNNSRTDSWDKNAIKQLSDSLQKELPDLRGFSESSITHMREFYEQWQHIFQITHINGQIDCAGTK
ncbi:MAG: DUF1016 N-terminal domain-containing protein [Candidatus Bathyarchaeota archaeon]|nr:DUF1016 N-terminal domain-containing protein [Candidatus Termiticorpusculum sp.]